MSLSTAKTLASVLLLSTVLFSCQKDDTTPVTPEPEEQSETNGTLVSAKLTSCIPYTDALKDMLDDFSEDIASLVDQSSIASGLESIKIATYEISYWTTVRDSDGYRPAILKGDVSFLTEDSGISGKRTLESVTLFNTCFTTCAADTRLCESYINPRAAYNALIVFPLYQGGSVDDDGKITIEEIITSSEFLMKGRQAIDCELAALEFIDKLGNVSMASGYYTENVGLSNGGGTALAVPYLLENDKEYKQFSDKINLRSSYVGEGNISSKVLFDNVLNGFDGSEETKFFNASIDVDKLGAVGYITTIVGTYYTWQDKYFKDVKLEDYFTPGVGKAFLDLFLANDESLLYAVLGSDTDIFDFVPSNLYERDSNGNYSFKKGTIIDNMYEAFSENEVILSGWTPKTPLRFTHSLNDEFLPYETNFNAWKTLSTYGTKFNVSMGTILAFEHIDATIYLMFTDVILSKHQVL